MNHSLGHMMYNRFPKSKIRGKSNTNGYTNIGKYKRKDRGIKPYLKSKAMRFLMKCLFYQSLYSTQKPMMKKQSINRYTAEGRALIHKNLAEITEAELKWLRETQL